LSEINFLVCRQHGGMFCILSSVNFSDDSAFDQFCGEAVARDEVNRAKRSTSCRRFWWREHQKIGRHEHRRRSRHDDDRRARRWSVESHPKSRRYTNAQVLTVFSHLWHLQDWLFKVSPPIHHYRDINSVINKSAVYACTNNNSTLSCYMTLNSGCLA